MLPAKSRRLLSTDVGNPSREIKRHKRTQSEVESYASSYDAATYPTNPHEQSLTHKYPASLPQYQHRKLCSQSCRSYGNNQNINRVATLRRRIGGEIGTNYRRVSSGSEPSLLTPKYTCIDFQKGNNISEHQIIKKNDSIIVAQAGSTRSSRRQQDIYDAQRLLSTTAFNSGKTPVKRLTRSFYLLLFCVLLFYGSFWALRIALAYMHSFVVFTWRGVQGKEHQQKPNLGDQLQLQQQQIAKFQDVFGQRNEQIHGIIDGRLRGSLVSENKAVKIGAMSRHELNRISHEQRSNDKIPFFDHQEMNNGVKESEDDIENNVQSSYIGEDVTTDFFYAGEVTEQLKFDFDKKDGAKQQIVYKYAKLPFLIDSSPFVLSIWIFLSLESTVPSVNVERFVEENRGPRVILSTQVRDVLGCSSDVFNADGPVSGMTLYAQPHFSDMNNGEQSASKMYRIILEYATTESQLCRSLVGSNESPTLVQEGEWSNIVIFVTRNISREVENDQEIERVSLYVKGRLSGRDEYISSRLSSTNINHTTFVGLYDFQNDQSETSKNNHYNLNGRVGMLSYWEIGGPQIYSNQTSRMVVNTTLDEDHVVRSINRAAFDVRAIKELSSYGLALKQPSLMYTFDGQSTERKAAKYHPQFSTSVVKEIMSKVNGEIVTLFPNKKNVSWVKKPFVALGGNRFSEYRDGTYVSPKRSKAELQELEEVAYARSLLVKDAMSHVWEGYKKYAWGKDELLPVSNNGQDNWGGMGTTLVDSLSTLWMMDMKDEFWAARDWVKLSLNFNNVKKAVSVFETTIRNLGSLLSAYDLSGDSTFLKKADDLGTRLLRAFDTPTGVPYGEVELFEGGHAFNTDWHPHSAVLAEIGTLQVEFRYLARVTGKTEFATVAMRALDELLKLDTESGLYPTFIHNTKHSLSFANNDISIGAMGDSFYEYLLKIWLQGGKTETKYRKMYDKAINGIINNLAFTSRQNHLTYVAELLQGRVNHRMDHLSCFLGGNLALGAYTHPDGLDSEEAQTQLKTGKQLAYTCYQMYARGKYGLPPEYVKFNSNKDDFVNAPDASYYILRPEASETFFILYHLTKDPVYREWGWEVFQAVEEHCRTDSGYAAIKNVDSTQKEDRMESFFTAETLKYLFLLQDNKNELDLLNLHVLNTEAHPLRLLNYTMTTKK